MIRKTVGLAGLALASLAVAACGNGREADATDKADSVREQEVSYTEAPLSHEHFGALTQHAFSQMKNGVVGDAAMIVSPQPSDTPKGKLLVAVQYGECGHSLGRAVIVEETLVVEKKSPPPGGHCAGTSRSTAILVTLPANASVKDARVESVE